jgi:hypothetical protein
MEEKSLKKIIAEVHKIIGYNQDPEIIDDLISLCNQQAVFNLINSLSKENRDIFKDQLAEAKSLQEAQKIMFKFFTKEERLIVQAKAAGEILSKYIKAIWPVLSADKKKEVLVYLNPLIDKHA